MKNREQNRKLGGLEKNSSTRSFQATFNYLLIFPFPFFRKNYYTLIIFFKISSNHFSSPLGNHPNSTKRSQTSVFLSSPTGKIGTLKNGIVFVVLFRGQEEIKERVLYRVPAKYIIAEEETEERLIRPLLSFFFPTWYIFFFFFLRERRLARELFLIKIMPSLGKKGEEGKKLSGACFCPSVHRRGYGRISSSTIPGRRDQSPRNSRPWSEFDERIEEAHKHTRFPSRPRAFFHANVQWWIYYYYYLLLLLLANDFDKLTNKRVVHQTARRLYSSRTANTRIPVPVYRICCIT